MKKMKKDIENRADIELLVFVFYENIKKDNLLGFIFEDVAEVDWAIHIPKMTDFWENVIFHTGNYEGSPMNLHTNLHKVIPLTEQHFERWNQLFIDSISEMFAGKNVELAIARTMSISSIIKLKIMEYQLGRNSRS